MLECDFCGCYSPRPGRGWVAYPEKDDATIDEPGCPGLLPAVRRCGVRPPDPTLAASARLHLEAGRPAQPGRRRHLALTASRFLDGRGDHPRHGISLPAGARVLDVFLRDSDARGRRRHYCREDRGSLHVGDPFVEMCRGRQEDATACSQLLYLGRQVFAVRVAGDARCSMWSYSPWASSRLNWRISSSANAPWPSSVRPAEELVEKHVVVRVMVGLVDLFGGKFLERVPSDPRNGSFVGVFRAQPGGQEHFAESVCGVGYSHDATVSGN